MLANAGKMRDNLSLMEIIIQPTVIEASKLAAAAIARAVKAKPNAVLGLATGNTPLMLYKELIRLHREEGLDFSQVRTFNLDEYCGLAPDDRNSYRFFMNENFFKHVNIDLANTHVPDGLVKGADIPRHCSEFEDRIRAVGGLDIQLLGIGVNGHIGFNEPGSSLASRTRLKTLTVATRNVNAPNFASLDEMPFHALTMGIATIMDARQVFLLAFGESKAEVVAGAVEGAITASNPASILQMHPATTMFLDTAAASRLTRCDYYNWIYANKPDWKNL